MRHVINVSTDAQNVDIMLHQNDQFLSRYMRLYRGHIMSHQRCGNHHQEYSSILQMNGISHHTFNMPISCYIILHQCHTRHLTIGIQGLMSDIRNNQGYTLLMKIDDICIRLHWEYIRTLQIYDTPHWRGIMRLMRLLGPQILGMCACANRQWRGTSSIISRKKTLSGVHHNSSILAYQSPWVYQN